MAISSSAESTAAAMRQSGMREFVFYTGDPEKVHRVLEEISGLVSSREVQPIIEPDTIWVVFRQFAQP